MARVNPIPLTFRPGIVRDRTNYANEGGWYDCNLVRFHLGLPEIFKGWRKWTSAAMAGVPRSLFPWSTNAGARYYGVGTNLKYYLIRGIEPIDITPVRRTVTLGTDPFETVSAGSGLVKVNDADHGASVNDYTTFSGATGPIDGIPASDLNTEHQVVALVDDDNYHIEAATVATAGGVSGGGAAVAAAYQINTGLNTTVLGDGWGTDTWGSGAWGEASGILGGSSILRLWSQDNFGEDLVFKVRDGGIYYKDVSGSLTDRGVPLTALSGANEVPTVARQVLVNDASRHAIAFAPNPLGSSVQDLLLVRWSDAENIAEWFPSTVNSSGDFRVDGGSEIVVAVQTTDEILIFTDVSLHSMRYVGPPFTYGRRRVGRNISIAGPNAVITVGSEVYWMGQDAFYTYAGRVEQMPCTIQSFIFDTMVNMRQRHKITAGLYRGRNEIRWDMPVGSATENNFYVVYNYQEKAWYYGYMPRTAWIDATYLAVPLAASPDGFLYEQETGNDDGSVEPAVPLNAYVQSSDFDLSEGGDFIYTQRVIPDVTFEGSAAANPTVTFTVTPRNYPGGTYRDDDDVGDVLRSAAAPVELYTESVPLRVRGRAIRVKVSSNQLGVHWRLGVPRVMGKSDGRR